MLVQGCKIGSGGSGRELKQKCFQKSSVITRFSLVSVLLDRPPFFQTFWSFFYSIVSWIQNDSKLLVGPGSEINVSDPELRFTVCRSCIRIAGLLPSFLINSINLMTHVQAMHLFFDRLYNNIYSCSVFSSELRTPMPSNINSKWNRPEGLCLLVKIV